MDIKTIIVGLTELGALNAPTAAAELAERFDAGVIGFGGRYVPSVLLADGGGDLYAAEEARNLIELKAMERAFEDVVPTRRRLGWRSAMALPDVGLAIEARAADLVMIEGSRLTHAHYNVGSLILSAGRPVLVVADGATAVAAKRILVAWKDTREARRAVADALPFLARAEEVVIAAIDEGDGIDPDGPAAVRQHLLRHGIESRVDTRLGAGREIAATRLHDMAVTMGADLMVAGFYGHSRLREWAFGGVTRSLLAYRDISYLFAS